MDHEKPRVLNVGQCDFDHATIERLLAVEFGAVVSRAAGAAETLESVRKGRFDLVLVNRVLDADQTSGMDLIRELQHNPETRGTPVALVINLPEAQAEAVTLGAKQGFGKNALNHAETRARLASLLGDSA